MEISKYKNVGGLEVNVSPYLYSACDSNSISYKEIVSEGNKRLDHYAYEYYGNSRYWWVIAACSGIGWPLQVPSGIRIRIPLDINQVQTVIRSI